MSPSGKPQGPRLYYSNDYLESVGVHLSALVRNWLESLPGFIGLEAQTLTVVRKGFEVGSKMDRKNKSENSV